MRKYFIYVLKAIVFIFLGVILFFVLIYIYQEINRCPGETILVPKNYIGYIYIIYDEDDGIYKKENRKMLYEIPSSGIYKTSSKYSKRLHTYEHTIEFYYNGNDGNRKIIPNYTHGRIEPIIDSSTVVARVTDHTDNWRENETFKSGPYLIYQIDSLKNLNKRAPPLSKDQYENWNKK